jgi:tRNA isopentenyl-2-thiomethyl-A-37 hydroxylase MiaE
VLFRSEGYFENVTFLLIKGTYQGGRDKDLWDSMEHLIPEEVKTFDEVFDFVGKRGVKTHTIYNNFNDDSVNEFNSFLKGIK